MTSRINDEVGFPSEVAPSSSFLSLLESYRRLYASSDDHTSRAKRLDLDWFIKFLQNDCGYASARQITVADWTHAAITRFVESRLQCGERPATVNRRLATIKHMGRVLAERIRGFINPAREVRGPRLDPLKPKGLTAEEFQNARARALHRQKSRPTFSSLRDRVIFEFLIETGLRADEIRLLRYGQVDEKREWLRDVRTKGKKFRRVYIPSTVRDLFLEYLGVRGELLKKFFGTLPAAEAKKLPVFMSTFGAVPGEPDSFLMAPKTVWRAVKRLSGERKLHPHLLRHSFALDLLESSSDVRLVAQALGHSDVRVTMRYTQRRDEEVAEALESRKKRTGA